MTSLRARVATLLHEQAHEPGFDERHARDVLGYARRSDHPWEGTPLNQARPHLVSEPEGTRKERNEHEFNSAREFTA
jgi:hypothetical protein